MRRSALRTYTGYVPTFYYQFMAIQDRLLLLLDSVEKYHEFENLRIILTTDLSDWRAHLSAFPTLRFVDEHPNKP